MKRICLSFLMILGLAAEGSADRCALAATVLTDPSVRAANLSMGVVKVFPNENLAAVRDRIRAWRAEHAAHAKEKVRVELTAGRYELSAPLALGPEDSHVEWAAEVGAEVRIAGGLLVTCSPEPVSDREILDLLPACARGKAVAYDLHKLDLDDWGDYLYNSEDAVQRRVAKEWGQGEFTMGSHPPPSGQRTRGRLELFVDDHPLTVARSAAGTFYHVDRLLGKVVRRGSGKGVACTEEGRFTVKEPLPTAWAKEPDPHVCGCWCRDWAEQHQRVVRFDVSSRTLELSRPWHQYCYKSGAYFYGFNMLSELDEPGEWYLHRKTGKLIVWMPEGGARRVELSRASRLFELTGAKDVVFRGLVLETCRNSAVLMKACTDCRVEACTIRNVGQHALIVEDGERCGARGCRFYGMGGGGAWLVDANRATLKSSGHFVEDCDIHDFGRWNRMYRPGVCLSGVGMRAERNRIHDSPHAAVLYFGCNLLMRSNEVFRVCSGSKDCGAFYTGRSWMLRGNRLEGNYIHDIIGLGGAPTRTVYLDDSVAEVEIVGNRFERCTWALFLGGARECVITNNVFVDCPGALYVDKRGTGWQKPHLDKRLQELAEKGTVYGLSCRQGPYADAFPAVKGLPGPHPYEPVKNVIAHNRFVRGEAVWIGRHAPKRADDPRWWRDGDVTDAELGAWGVFADNAVDNAGLASAAPSGEGALLRIVGTDGRRRVERRAMTRMTDGAWRLKFATDEMTGIRSVDVVADMARVAKGEGYWVSPDGHYGAFTRDDGAYFSRRARLAMYGVCRPEGSFVAIVKGLRTEFGSHVVAKGGVYEIFPRFELEKIEFAPYEDIVIDFYPLAGGDANYSGMARRYRAWQLARGEVRPLAEKAKASPALAYAAKSIFLRYKFGRTFRRDVDHRIFATNTPPMTVDHTFDEFMGLLREAKALGLDDVDMCLVGWQREGHDGPFPDHFPVDARFGGEAKMREAVKLGHDLGYRMSVHLNYHNYYPAAKRWRDADVCKGPDGKPRPYWLLPAGQAHYSCFEVMVNRYVDSDFAHLRDIGIDGILHHDVTSAEYPTPCHDPQHPNSRGKMTDWQLKLCEKCRETFGGSSSESGLDHIARGLDNILYVAWTVKDNPLVDGMLPVWPIVYNGICMSQPFYGTIDASYPRVKGERLSEGTAAYHRIPTPEERMLKVFEWGGRPAFYYNPYTDLRPIKRMYDLWLPLRHLQFVFIREHVTLAPGVTATRYENGEEVACNATRAPFAYRGRTINPMNYRLYDPER